MKYYYIVFENKEPFLCQTESSEAALMEARKRRGKDAILKSFNEISEHKAGALKGFIYCHYFSSSLDSRYFVVKAPNCQTLGPKLGEKCGIDNKISYLNVCALDGNEVEVLSVLESDEIKSKIGEHLKFVAEEKYEYQDCNITLEIKPSEFTGNNQVYLRIEKDGSVRGFTLEINEITREEYVVLCKHGVSHI